MRVAPGFRVTLYADHELANDIFAMTLDAQGRVVVTGPDYIKVLHDTKGAGKADRATLFATPTAGGMGMCFDGNDLYFCGGGWLSRYRDPASKGVADGPPERILPLAYGEHGGHAMRKGPDGYWYVIGGNDSKITSRLINVRHSPIQQPEAGALLRLSPDCREREVIAHGFRNPYDFDFNAAGDLFTYDSDCERDFFLPWYTPTRMYHIQVAGHHGWRLPGGERSWCRRDDYLDTVDMLWPVGRGSPTGVVCYRHEQFPEHYRGGLFVLDWTFGRVYFFPWQPDGSSYRTQPEIFLEAIGTNGFDPTDVVVTPDGSLLVCMGGRGTRGAVYRIEYVGPKESSPKPQAPHSELSAILRADQPLDAWSRARWVPAARRLGPTPFAQVIANEKWDVAGRVRAIEITTELFDGLPDATAKAAARASSPWVRSRVAWSLGRRPCAHYEAILRRLSEDPDARVRRCALEGLIERFYELTGDVSDVLPSNFASPDKRVRQTAARLAAMLSATAWQKLGTTGSNASPQARLSLALAAVWRASANECPGAAMEAVLEVLKSTADADLRLEAVRLIMLALGDYHLNNPEVEAWTAYSFQKPLDGVEPPVARILPRLRPVFPSGDNRLDEELARVLAMLEDDDAGTVAKVAGFWTDSSSPTQDMHYLVVASCLRGARDPAVTTKTARTLISLHRKLEGREQRVKQVWSQRLTEVATKLIERDPHLSEALLREPGLIDAGNLAIALALPRPQRACAARLFFSAAQKNSNFAWSGPLLELIEELPAQDSRSLVRAQWANLALRDAILLDLARDPDEADRERLLAGLDSAQPEVVQACLAALGHLARDPAPERLVPILRLLMRMEQEPKQEKTRREAVDLLTRQSGVLFAIAEKGTSSTELAAAYQPVFNWFSARYPSFVEALHPTNGEDRAAWNRLFSSVEWSKGDINRGAILFRDRACQTCHAGSRALGPDLTGVTSRFSREDLFTAIIDPSRDVAPAYRTNAIETRNGQFITGMVTFESADGLIIQTGATTTVRIATPDIVSRLPSNRSLMPDGLLKDLKAGDLADLYGYLQTLKAKDAVGNR